MRRVYLDQAATSWPKNEAAIAASYEFVRSCGATAGRGTYGSANEANNWLHRARVSIAELLSAQANEIAFASSGTHALNAAMAGLLKDDSHVIATAIEHNSVLRPLAHWQQQGKIDLDVVPTAQGALLDPDAASSLLRPKSAFLVVGHASNVTGVVTNLQHWTEWAHEHGLKVIVDGSQTLGYLPIDFGSLGIDVLAAAGHKGLRAMQGTGMLCVAQQHHASLQPFMSGGTGEASNEMSVPPSWPHTVEVGNLNLPGIVSMAVAAEECGSQIAEYHWLENFWALVSGLRTIRGIRVLGKHTFQSDVPEFVPVVSVDVEGWDPHDLAAILDSSFGIEARAGWHCAARVHEGLGTAAAGTLRFSTGYSTTAEEIDYTLKALKEVLSS